MKPNGRRRWRKRAKWLRHRTRTDWPQLLEYATDQVRASLLRIRKSHDSLPLPPLPPRPFSPRSLVGMTQGARKRAARIQCVGHPFKTKPLKLLWFRYFRRDAAGRQETDADRALLHKYAHLRTRYRIGERLRPCPGCLRCRSCAGCEVLTFEGDACKDCGREAPMATESCDGASVLPALT